MESDCVFRVLEPSCLVSKCPPRASGDEPAVAEVRAEADAKAAEQDARITAQDIVIVQCTELVDSFRAYTLTLLQRWPRCAVLPTCDLPPPPSPPSTLGLAWPPR